MDIKCLIVDDEPPAVDELNFILSEINGVQIVGSAFSAGQAIQAIRSKQPDLVFLDIKMPGRDGFEVIKACRSFRKKPFFVFATAYDEHAVQAFETCAVDYILKPFRAERVEESVERVQRLMIDRQQEALCGQLEEMVARLQPAPRAVNKISVEHQGRILLLDPEDIVYFKAEKKAILACTESRCFMLHGLTSLDNLQSKLSGFGFFRSHRGFLVNLTCVKEVVPWFNGKYILTANDQAGTEVPVSRRRVKSLKHRLGL